MIIVGWLIDWPTLITIIFVPILVYKYAMAGRVEEKEILKEHPDYQKYIDSVPYFL